jgi:transposase-like protein
MTDLKKCAFCSRPFSKTNYSTNEHVFPDWLVKEYDLINKPLNQFRLTFKDKKDRLLVKGKDANLEMDEMKEARRQMSLGGAFVLGGVCKDCNENFLGRIETRARKPLKRMVNRKKIKLSKEDVQNVSIWSYKTALVLNRSSSHKRFWVDHAYSKFYGGSLPKDLFITASLLDKKNINKESYFLQWEGIPISTSEAEMGLAWRVSRKTGIYKEIVKAPKNYNTYLKFAEETKTVLLNINGLLLKIITAPFSKYPIERFFKKEGETVLHPYFRAPNWPPSVFFRSLVELHQNFYIKWNN